MRDELKKLMIEELTLLGVLNDQTRIEFPRKFAEGFLKDSPYVIYRTDNDVVEVLTCDVYQHNFKTVYKTMRTYYAAQYKEKIKFCRDKVVENEIPLMSILEFLSHAGIRVSYHSVGIPLLNASEVVARYKSMENDQ